MTKLGVAFWIGLVLASGFTTFKVKHAVQDIDDEVNRLRKQAIAEQQETRVLTAEWTYLNQPERLAELNRAFLQLTPITPKQLQIRVEDIPLRAPSAAPDMLVAANPPAVPQPAAMPPAVPAATIPRVPMTAAAAPGAVPAPAPAAPVPVAVPVAAAAAARPPVRLAKASVGSLDALIAHIAETH